MKASSVQKESLSAAPAPVQPVAKPSEVTRFFEKSGVMDALTRVFITMYEEKEEWPANGPAHLLNLLTPGLSVQEELDTLGEHIYRLRARVAELTEKNDTLRERIQEHETRPIQTQSPKTSPTEIHSKEEEFEEEMIDENETEAGEEYPGESEGEVSDER